MAGQHMLVGERLVRTILLTLLTPTVTVFQVSKADVPVTSIWVGPQTQLLLHSPMQASRHQGMGNAVVRRIQLGGAGQCGWWRVAWECAG